VLGEVSEVLHVQRRERQAVGKTAGGDPRVVDRVPSDQVKARCDLVGSGILPVPA
jgi:hypothetical protein